MSIFYYKVCGLGLLTFLNMGTWSLNSTLLKTVMSSSKEEAMHDKKHVSYWKVDVCEGLRKYDKRGVTLLLNNIPG